MKATMDHNGTLILTPESGLEAFALRSWHQRSDEGLSVKINPMLTGLEVSDPVQPIKTVVLGPGLPAMPGASYGPDH